MFHVFQINDVRSSYISVEDRYCKILMMFFWVKSLSGLVVASQRFGDTNCLERHILHNTSEYYINYLTHLRSSYSLP
jgi:hypothetical protein